MPKFLEITLSDGEKMLINVHNIASICSIQDDPISKTKIWERSYVEQPWYVAESYEAFVKALSSDARRVVVVADFEKVK